MKILVKISIIAIIAVVIASGIFVWQKGWLTKINQQIATANWKTYKHEEYGFEFQYPKNWGITTSGYKFFVNDLGSESTETSDGKIYQNRVVISIESSLAGYSLEEWIKIKENNPVGAKFYKMGDISVAGVPAVRGTFGCCMNYPETVFFIKDNSIFEIQGGNLGVSRTEHYDYENVFNKIVSTFKFTDISKFTGVSKQQIKTGKIDINNNQVAELQKAVDAGQQPRRLDIIMAALADLPQYGFTQDDLKNLQCPHIASNWVVGKDITGLWCEVSHDNQKYLVLVSQPQPGINKIWMVSEIEKPPLK